MRWRERHTFETLLASPINRNLFGKVAAVVGYAWILTLASAGGISNGQFCHGNGELLFYPVTITVGGRVC